MYIIYISLLPQWFGDLHTYVTKQKNNNEKKVKMKQKENNKQKYMSKQIHSIVRRVSKIQIERKDEDKKWNICAWYKMKHTRKVWQQEHTKVMETARGKQK